MVSQATSKRPICPSCSKPARLCLCIRLKTPSIENSVGVTILQHSLEKKHPLNSTRIATLGLKNLNVLSVSDVNFEARFVIRLLDPDSGMGSVGSEVKSTSLCGIQSQKNFNHIDGFNSQNGSVVNSEHGQFSEYPEEKNTSFINTNGKCDLKSDLIVKESIDGKGSCALEMISDCHTLDEVMLDGKTEVAYENKLSEQCLDPIGLVLRVKKLQKKQLNESNECEDYEEFEITVPPGSVLLFPSEISVGFEGLDFEVKNLIVLDGTWAKAKRMYNENPWLKLLPHLKLDLEKVSLYSEVRHQPQLGCLSTIESIVYALKAAGDDHEGLDDLLDVFESMSERPTRSESLHLPMLKLFSWRCATQQALTLYPKISSHLPPLPLLYICRFRSRSQFHSQSEDTYDPPFSAASKYLKPKKNEKNKIRDQASLDSRKHQNFPVKSDLPFDFRYSYSETNPSVEPIGFREPPRFSPFGPGRLDRKWAGISALAEHPVDLAKVAEERNAVLGEPLTEEEIAELVERYRHSDCSRQINLGKGGVTHNMLEDIHNHWKRAEAVRIKCLGVPTLDMENVCFHLEDKSGGKIICRHINMLLLYRGRHYDPKSRPVIPLMLWKPYAPIYPKLVKNVADGLTFEETKEMRNRGLNSPPLMKLTRNGVYVNVVERLREAFEIEEVVRLDCSRVGTSDCKRIGVKLRELVPCVPILFKDDQIILWRGKRDQEQDSSSLMELTSPQML
ncbi:hypothetical protein F0562_010115 [Nyssa sinensis]|uniref:tRNA-uridine aminocarboxypropyltransferase n=1 Tax=Nyssa sinensis TaxID=561372 RepID=A0A5J5A1N7_9ASTE|nr:hypothetical protein F0562_010115 [Nyssa sinensis]